MNRRYDLESTLFEIYPEFDELFEAFDMELGDQAWAAEVGRARPDYIRRVQGSLNRILGLRLPLDGVMGRETRSAIRSFQRRRGLLADGAVSHETEQALNAAARRYLPNRRGIARLEPDTFGDEFELRGKKCRGFEIETADYIKWVQRSLNRILGIGLTVDGKASDKYRKAVREFQSWLGFKLTGQVNEETQNELIRANEQDRAYIAWVQNALNRLGAGLKIDGDIGSSASKTRKAIRGFQGKRTPDLCVDGFVGAKTELRLIEAGGGLPPGHIAPKSDDGGKRTAEDRKRDRERARPQFLAWAPRAVEVLKRRPNTEPNKRTRCLLQKLQLPDVDDRYMPQLYARRYHEARLKGLPEDYADSAMNAALDATRWAKDFNDFIDRMVSSVDNPIFQGLREVYKGYQFSGSAPEGSPVRRLRDWVASQQANPNSIYNCYI